MIGLGYESIHACEHDCCLFRGEVNKDLQFCLVCNTSRWKDSDTPGKKVPRKVLRYFPIIPRLQRLYKSRHTAKDMIWHATGKCTEPGKMQHPVDGGAWKKFDMKYPDFAKEPRNVRLGLCADGFNPFGNLSQTYSMWPVILTTYNLPPWLCMKESNFMLTLLIPGPKSPGKDIDVYLRPLIEDLQVLWDKKGVETTDIVSGQNFNMRAMVLWTINDFPARSSLFGWSGQGKPHHKWRSSREFNGDTDHRDPPKEYPRDVILAQHARLLTRASVNVVEILCELERIYPPAFFDIMIHLPIHLALEALEGGRIHPRRTMILAMMKTPFPHDLADSNVEDSSLMMMRVEKVFILVYMADVAENMAGDCGGEDLQSTSYHHSVARVASSTEEKEQRLASNIGRLCNARRIDPGNGPGLQKPRTFAECMLQPDRSIFAAYFTLNRFRFLVSLRPSTSNLHTNLSHVLPMLSYTAPVDRSRDVDFMMSLMRSDNRFADAFARYDSGGASGSGGSRARDSEGGEDGDDMGGEDGGDDTS
ncbi:hypothetical protein Tco_0093321 [Tanacetum coccineum]